MPEPRLRRNKAPRTERVEATSTAHATNIDCSDFDLETFTDNNAMLQQPQEDQSNHTNARRVEQEVETDERELQEAEEEFVEQIAVQQAENDLSTAQLTAETHIPIPENAAQQRTRERHKVLASSPLHFGSRITVLEACQLLLKHCQHQTKTDREQLFTLLRKYILPKLNCLPN